MKATDQKLERLLTAIKAGTDLDTSAHYAGLSVQEVYRWLELGKIENDRRNGDEKADESLDPEVKFWLDLTTARAEAIVRNVAQIQQAAASGEWKAAAWWLERAVPESYSAKSAEKRAEVNKGNSSSEITGK
jgi:hypothetical protein